MGWSAQEFYTIDGTTFGSSKEHKDRADTTAEHGDSPADASDSAIADVAQRLWDNVESFGDGLRQSWKGLVGHGDPVESFANDFTQYVRDSPELERQQPERHAFLRDHVFFGSSDYWTTDDSF